MSKKEYVTEKEYTSEKEYLISYLFNEMLEKRSEIEKLEQTFNTLQLLYERIKNE